MKKIKLLHLSLFAAALVASACGVGRHSGEPRGVVREGGTYITKLGPVEKEGGLELGIEGSGKLQYTIFRLENPRRVVLDLPETDASAFSAPINLSRGPVWQVQAHYFAKQGNSRIEIFVKDAVQYNVVSNAENRITVGIKPAKGAAEGTPETPGEELPPGGTEIGVIELGATGGLARIVIPYKGETPKYEMVRKRELNRITLDILNARIRKSNEKLLSADAKGTLVKNVAAFQFTTKPPAVKVIANLSEFSSSNAYEKDGSLILDIGTDAVLASASVMKDEKKEKVSKATEVSAKKEKLPSDFEGRKISLDFQGADIHNILRIIADVSGQNIITSEKVTGKVTMKLVEVPWDMALDIILKNNNLGMVRTGNIIRVATTEELSKAREMQATDQQVVEKVEPLYLKVFPVNYETSVKLKTNLEAVKSPRGTIDINERTNALIIQDTKDRLAEMEKLIEVLDKRTVQVLIEARIVEVTHTYAKELGIRWGGNYLAAPGVGFPATVGLSGISGTSASALPGSIVNTPTSALTGALDIRLGSVNSTAMLDLQLMAAQNDGKGRILSMPKIATMNNIEATIESGNEIPFQTTSANGTQTQFKQATLSLKVTPHVAEDNFIRLDIDAHKDEPDFAHQLPNSPPPLLTKHAKTVVLVKDGETTVLGGLFKETTTENSSSVPFFAKIPVLGWFFKNKADSESGEELLIFITPKVL